MHEIFNYIFKLDHAESIKSFKKKKKKKRVGSWL